MLEDIKTLIEKDEFKEADLQLKNIINDTDKDTELYSNATYLRGCVNIEYKFKEKNNFIAKNSFMECINSKYPLPLAFCRYADLEEDNNISINYLKLGLEKFPQDGTLYKYLLKKTKIIKDKFDIIKKIEELKIVDYYLFLDIIDIYINNNMWEECYLYSETILSSFKLENNENIFFNLISAFALIKSEILEFLPETEKKLLEIIKKDIRNDLHYASYMGLIWLYIITDNKEKATEYFDKIPFNGLQDYDNTPWLIYINFDTLYKIIFNKLNVLYTKDKKRKQKIQILYAMYVCQREYYWENVNNIQKRHVTILKKAFKDYPAEMYIGKYLFSSQIKLNLYFDAYMTVIDMYKAKSSFLNYICFEELLDNIDEVELLHITNQLSQDIQTFILSDTFIKEIIDPIITHIYKSDIENKYRSICNIANHMNNNDINISNCKFEIAYSYGDMNQYKKAENIYKLQLKTQPNSSSVINNLGVIYKENKEFEKAMQYFTKACKINPDDEICSNNLQSVKKHLQEQKNKKYKNLTNTLNIEFFENIGYNDNLRCLLEKISNEELKELLLQDIEECAICIATNQNKSAIILCGSIVEAILMDCILSRNIKKYKIKDKNKSIKDMSLNELLTVAKQEGMISDTTYNLSHFIKDYRNIIHPSNLLRNSFKISNERVMVIWNILKEIMESLLN